MKLRNQIQVRVHSALNYSLIYEIHNNTYYLNVQTELCRDQSVNLKSTINLLFHIKLFQ